MLRRIVSNIKWLAVYALVGRSSWLVTLYLMASSVGAATNGEFSFYLTFWIVANKLFGFGLDIWLKRHIASGHCGHLGSVIKQIALLRLLIVGCGFILLGAFSLAFMNDYFLFMVLFIVLGLRQIAESMREVAIGALQGLEKMRLQAVSMFPWDIAQLVILSFLIFSINISTIELLALVLLLTAIGKIVTLYAVLSMVLAPTDLGEHSFLDVKEVLSNSKYIGLTILAGAVIGQSHILYLRLLTDSVTVGNFAFAYLFITVALVGLGTLRQALFPTMSRLGASDDMGHFVKVFVKAIAVFFLLGLSIVGILILFAKTFMPKLIDISYTDSLHMLSIISWVLPGASLSGAMGNFLIASGNAKLVSRTQLIGMIVNQFLNMTLISLFGWVGAFLAVLITYMLMAFLYWRIFSNKISVSS